MPPPAPVEGSAAHTRAWRGFGEGADLDLDFNTTSQPELVTAVLAACSVSPIKVDTLWAMTLAERIGALATIVEQTDGGDCIAWTQRCPHCSETLEISVPCTLLRQEVQRSQAQPDIMITLDASRSLLVRRPTGADQRAWRGETYGTEEEAAAAILRRLVMPAGAVPHALNESDLQYVSDELEMLDPLSAFQVTTVCPGCGAAATLQVDLEATLLTKLRIHQRALVAVVHRLAAAYGWTEDEILAIPPHRREDYLSLIAQEGIAR